MRRSVVVVTAGACGAGAFLWSLVSARPEEDPRIEQARIATAAGVAMRSNWPRDPDRLAAWVTEHPDEYAAWFDLAEFRRNGGDEAGAQAAWEKVAEGALQRAGDPVEGVRALFMLGWASDRLGRDAEAQVAYYKLAELAETHGTEPILAQSARYWHRLGVAYHRLGRTAQATRALEQSVELLRAHGVMGRERPMLLARGLTLLGRTEEAMEVLEREAPRLDPAVLAHDELLAPLREDARFAEIERRAGTATGIVTGG